MLTLEYFCKCDYMALIFDDGIFEIYLLSLARFKAHALVPFVRVAGKYLSLHTLDLHNGDARGEDNDVIHVGIDSAARRADGEKGVCHNGKFTEIGDEEHARGFLARAAEGKYLAACGKGAYFDGDLPKAERYKDEYHAHYKRDEFFHYNSSFQIIIHNI